jgi:hypothetical protein
MLLKVSSTYYVCSGSLPKRLLGVWQHGDWVQCGQKRPMVQGHVQPGPVVCRAFAKHSVSTERGARKESNDMVSVQGTLMIKKSKCVGTRQCHFPPNPNRFQPSLALFAGCKKHISFSDLDFTQ